MLSIIFSPNTGLRLPIVRSNKRTGWPRFREGHQISIGNTELTTVALGCCQAKIKPLAMIIRLGIFANFQGDTFRAA